MLTGGNRSRGKGRRSGVKSTDVYAFDLRNGTWITEKLPSLNLGRDLHDSCTLGDSIYVVHGSVDFMDPASIETLDMSKPESEQKWYLYAFSRYKTKFHRVAVCPLEHSN